MKNAIVIPCYNEADRLKFDQFQKFINEQPEYQLCFVNDGSQDATLEQLLSFQTKNNQRVTIHNLVANQGKAEAVRQGVLQMTNKSEVQNIGFMDADLATGFEDYTRLVSEMKKEGKDMVVGSRKLCGCVGVKRSAFRKMASLVIGYIIKLLISMPIKDTQCGAKVFEKSTAAYLFKSSFISRWLFDVELFIRMRNLYGAKVMDKVSEVALLSWKEVEGSKISLKDSLKFPMRLAEIAYDYRVKPLSASITSIRLSRSKVA